MTGMSQSARIKAILRHVKIPSSALVPISISDEPMTTFDQPISASLAGFFLVCYKEHLELIVF